MQLIRELGSEVCIEAYKLHQEGNGAKTIGNMLNTTTAQADCLIDGGKFLEYIYQKSFEDAIDLMNYHVLEPKSALKQSAHVNGIEFGDEMGKFVDWAMNKLKEEI
mgnify:FL=1|tara:strand:- start:239 stop:556 length:318 start_codon:yes stop_codon:yes gene_type:complete